MPQEKAELPEILHYRPWQVYDPVPWWILRFIDEPTIRSLAVIQLEAQRAVLEVQMKTIEKTLGVLKGGK